MTTFFHYSSIAAARSRSVAKPRLQHNKDRQGAILRETFRGSSWYGLETFDDVQKALDTGWAEGTARIEEMAKTISGSIRRPEGLQRRKTRGDHGDSLDIHSIYRGALDKAWETSHKKLTRSTGAIKLIVDIGGNCDVDSSVIQWRGVAGVVLARVMEKAGYKVQIDAGFYVKDYDSAGTLESVFTVTVKPQSARVNVDRLACTIGLAGFFRTVLFACIVVEGDAQKKKVSSGLGHITPIVDKLKTPDRMTAIFVPETVKDHDSAMAFCNDAIQLLRLA